MQLTCSSHIILQTNDRLTLAASLRCSRRVCNSVNSSSVPFITIMSSATYAFPHCTDIWRCKHFRFCIAVCIKYLELTARLKVLAIKLQLFTVQPELFRSELIVLQTWTSNHKYNSHKEQCNYEQQYLTVFTSFSLKFPIFV